MQAEVKLLFRYGLVYREVLKTPKFNFCEVVHQNPKEQILTNRAIYSAIKIVKDTYPQAFHECPYNVSKLQKFQIFQAIHVE